MRLHPEKIPSAIERYQKEILRVFGVLDSVLAQLEWLVGDKCPVADLSFIPWNNGVLQRGMLKDVPGVDVPAQFPAFYACVWLAFSCATVSADVFSCATRWHQKLLARDAVKKTLAVQASLQK